MSTKVFVANISKEQQQGSVSTSNETIKHNMRLHVNYECTMARPESWTSKWHWYRT